MLDINFSQCLFQQSRDICLCYAALRSICTSTKQPEPIFLISWAFSWLPQINMQIHASSLTMMHHSILKPQASCWPLKLNSMKTPGEVPGLPCSQGKPITTIGPAWLPVNIVTHKLIMPVSLLPPFSSLLPLTLSCSITPMTAAPPAWCPAHFPSAAHLLQSRSPLHDRAEA